MAFLRLNMQCVYAAISHVIIQLNLDVNSYNTFWPVAPFTDMDKLKSQIPTWICNYIHYEVRDENTYQFQSLSGATVGV